MTESKKARLLKAVQSCPDWTTQRELARRMGVRRLGDVDALYLDILAQEGHIEVQQVPRDGGIRFEYRYRAVKGKA